MKEIGFTGSKKPYGWMGNMSRYSITYLGKLYGSTEHLFQAMRFGLDSSLAERIRLEDNPYQAKQIAKKYRQYVILEPCSLEDIANMKVCLLLKIEQHPLLLQQLLETENTPIYEDVTARGRKGGNLFWGAFKNIDGTWEGKNVMGELWMNIRSNKKLNDEKSGTSGNIE